METNAVTGTLIVREFEESGSHSELDDRESSDAEQHSSQMELDNDPTHNDPTTCPLTTPDRSVASTCTTIITTTVGKSSMQSTLSPFILPKDNHVVSLEQIQSGINHLLVKMKSFTLKQKLCGI